MLYYTTCIFQKNEECVWKCDILFTFKIRSILFMHWSYTRMRVWWVSIDLQKIYLMKSLETTKLLIWTIIYFYISLLNCCFHTSRWVCHSMCILNARKMQIQSTIGLQPSLKCTQAKHPAIEEICTSLSLCARQHSSNSNNEIKHRLAINRSSE